jgi:hypothetical protein
MSEREYRRLTRARNRSFFAIAFSTRSSLWLGKDHLLQIDTSGYTESYKRFHFRDIQALVLGTTQTWLYLASAFGALAALCGVIAILGNGPIVAWIFGSMAGLFGLRMLFDLIAGPTTKCYLRTAVQTEGLVSVARLRQARKIFETLRPLITNAQGKLTPVGPPPAAQAQASPPVISELPRPVPEPQGEVSIPPQEQA